MKMNSEYSGSQRYIHLTKIKQEVGYIGPHEKIIEVGYEMHMLFQEGDNIPSWMTTQERVATKFGQYDDP